MIADSVPEISVVINGDSRSLAPGLSVSELLESLDLKVGMVVVELDREILARDVYSRTPVTDGAKIELVHFVGGG